jgi:hypothetical protein
MQETEMHTKFYLENLRERDHLEDIGTDGRIILNGYKERACDDVDWIYMA